MDPKNKAKAENQTVEVFPEKNKVLVFREQSPFNGMEALSNQKPSVPLPTSPLPLSEISSTLKLTSHPSVETLIQSLEASISPQVTNRQLNSERVPDPKSGERVPDPKSGAVKAAEKSEITLPVVIPYKILIPITRPTGTREASSEATSIKKKSLTLKPSWQSWDEKMRSSLGAMKSNIDHISKRYSCDICEKSFICAVDLKVHRKIHTRERPYSCSVCCKTFHRQCFLKKHLIIHTGEKSVDCFKNNLNPKNGEKSFSCETCPKSFSHECNLKKHRRIHTGEKLFFCDACQRSFGRASHLKVHLRSHTGEKPYSCGACEKTFCLPSYLKNHERIHYREKAHSCDSDSVLIQTLSKNEDHLPHMTDKKTNTGENNNHLKLIKQTDLGKHISNLETLEETPFVEMSNDVKEELHDDDIDIKEEFPGDKIESYDQVDAEIEYKKEPFFQE